MAGFCSGDPHLSAKTGMARMQTRRKSASQTIQSYDFLLPEPSQRRRPGPDAGRPMQIEDAVFEVLSVRPDPYRRTNDNPAPLQTNTKTEFLPLAARMAGRLAAFVEQQLTKLSPQAFVTLLSSLFLLVFWLCGGFSAIGASRTNIAARQPFELVDIFVASQDANGMKIAAITGGITNTSAVTMSAPRLTVVAGPRREPVGVIALGLDEIGPNSTIRFSSRFKLAGGKLSDITIIPEPR